jgi:hypothetical protein
LELTLLLPRSRFAPQPSGAIDYQVSVHVHTLITMNLFSRFMQVCAIVACQAEFTKQASDKLQVSVPPLQPILLGLTVFAAGSCIKVS